MAAFIQVPLGSAPFALGKYVAFLKGDSKLFSDLLGVNFERTRDHLDDVDGALILTKSGVYVLLGCYLNAPKRGVDVYIDGSSVTLKQDFSDVLEALGEAGTHLIWKDESI